MYNKIQFKIIALILLLTAIFVLGLLSLRNTENKNTTQLIKNRIAERDTLIRKIIDVKSKSLSNYIFDYSYWDEMVVFSKTLDEKWAKENIEATVSTFDVDAFCLFDKELNLLFSFNRANDRTFKLPLSKEDLKSITNKNLFSHFFINTNLGLMELYIAPLQPSSDINRVTPPLGFLAGGRLWSKEYLESLSFLTSSKMFLSSPFKDTALVYKNENDIINEIELKDWNNATLMKVKAISSSDALKDFLVYENYRYASIILFVILIIALISLYLYQLLNKPLKSITLSLEKESPEPLKEIINKKNEFGEMAKLINEFFENKNSLIAEIVMRTKAEESLLKKQGELIKAKEKAEELSKLKSNLLANLSHEFRTPLSGIIGISELLKEDIRDMEQLKLLNDITSSGKRLHDTLNSILMLAQFESSDIVLRKEKFNLTSEVRQYIDKLKYKAEEKNIGIKINSDDNDLFVDTDRDLLRNVIYNIFDNAVKFTDKGEIKINISSRITDNILNAVISISDTGIGIAHKYLDGIFEEFRQVSEGISRKYEGTGLGLTLSKKIITLLDGKIKVDSEPGIGSTFSVYLPAFIILTMQEKQGEVKTSGNKNLLNVLFVEDNPSNQYVFKKFLENEINVDFASNGENALDFVKIKKYDLVFMDINLGPGIDGIEVFKQIKKMDNYVDTPVAALTGYAMEHDKEHFLAIGFDYFIIKPFGRNDLMIVIEEVKNKVNKTDESC